ncbi:unnamed protein product [Strongylus vulgaris]|uniref:Uncharacterized protein n=1 Tax=Strongylus vulgaris TaxID=40348 RepID=A0A3P7LQ24_STRVU|nr:unnamed protein product [Strongylus vulgaris]
MNFKGPALTTTTRPTTTEATFPTFKLSDTHETLVTVQPVQSQPENKTKSSAPPVVSASTPETHEDVFEIPVELETVPSISNESTQGEVMEKTTQTEETELMTTEEVMTEKQTIKPSTTAAQIFVFTTTKAVS